MRVASQGTKGREGGRGGAKKRGNKGGLTMIDGGRWYDCKDKKTGLSKIISHMLHNTPTTPLQNLLYFGKENGFGFGGGELRWSFL